MEGQYLTFDSDLTGLSGQVYEVKICSLGIMGVEYVRSTNLDSVIELHY